jgi:DNA polymerase
MLIGEAPGQNEDETGVPFVGRAGKLLDMILLYIILQEKRIFIFVTP